MGTDEFELEYVKKKAREGGLLAFTGLTKSDYEVNWHHQYLCKRLNAFIKKEVRRLMIFMPPRYGKSELVSRRLPALIHGLYPQDEIMGATYNADLAADVTGDIQRIMDDPVYHDLFPDSRIPSLHSASGYARNSLEHELLPLERNGTRIHLKGKYRAQGIGGSFGGRGANWILIDDPIKNRADADSMTVRDSIWKFYSSTLRTRLEGDGSILITMTRWHQDDLCGRLLELARSDPAADQWIVIRFPAIREDMSNPDDPRALGEPLWPSKFSLENLMQARASNSRDWAALYQQRPAAEGGIIFKSEWFKEYDIVPDRFDQMIQSWDMASKDKTGSDFYVGTVWGRIGTNKYLVDMVRGQWSFPTACQKLMDLSRKYPRAHKKLIEAKANGPAVMQTLQSKVSGMVEVEPRGDKIARANAVAPEFEGGNVWLPHARMAPWIHEFKNELCDFPNGVHDDIVDSTSQAIDELRKAQLLYVPTAGHGSGTIF